MFRSSQKLAAAFRPTARRLASGVHPDEAAKPLAPSRNPAVLAVPALAAGMLAYYLLQPSKDPQGEHIGQKLQGAVGNAHTPEDSKRLKEQGKKGNSAGA